MQLETKHFGTITIEEDKILTFPDGIPGFEENTRYVFLQNPEEGVPFHWLQSIDDMELTFVIANPFLVRVDYDFELPDHVVSKLDIKDREEVQIFCIVRIPDKVDDMTINLAAPLILNTRTCQGKQVVLEDDRYHTRHLVTEELAESKRILDAANKAAAQAGEPASQTPAEGGQ